MSPFDQRRNKGLVPWYVTKAEVQNARERRAMRRSLRRVEATKVLNPQRFAVMVDAFRVD